MPIVEQEIRIVMGRRSAIGLFMRNAVGIIRSDPTIVPIARPRAHEGVIYQSLIITLFFIVYLRRSIIYFFSSDNLWNPIKLQVILIF